MNTKSKILTNFFYQYLVDTKSAPYSLDVKLENK